MLAFDFQVTIKPVLEPEDLNSSFSSAVIEIDG